MITVNKANPTQGEITSSLTGSTGDGAGLHLQNLGYFGWTNTSATNLGTSDFSIEFILNQTGDNSQDNYIWFTNFTGDNRAYFYNDTDANVIRLFFHDENGSASGTTFTLNYDMSADYGTPTHYTLTVDRSGDATLYKNGKSVASETVSAASDIDLGNGNTNAARIGSSSDGYSVLGTFYRFRTWNKSLSSAEVQTAFERADVDFADQYGSQTELVTNGDFASATGWSQNNVTIAGDGNAVWAVSGGDQWVRRADWNITAGKKYRITVVTSAHTDNGSFTVQTYGASGTIATTDLNGDAFTISSTGTHIFEFEALADSSGGVLFGSYPEGAAYVGTMTDLSCVQIGVVSDYDLAFANPKNSFKIKDRSGAADGTASNDGTNPTGISQVQVIKQLNTSELMVGGDVLMTSDASGKPVLTLQNTYSDEYGPEIVLERLNQYENDNDFLGTIRFKGDNNAQESTEYATIYSQCTKVNDGIEDGNLIFRTMKDGTLAARLTIGSDGLATFSNGINLGDTTLSNYDEGTWTVGFHDATSGGNASSTTATGNYTRVGRLVTVAFSVFDINISGMTSGNQMYFSLPFAVSSVVCIGSATTRDVELTNGTTINCAFNTGTQRGSFLSAQDNGAWSYPTVGDFSGTGDVYVTGQYMI